MEFLNILMLGVWGESAQIHFFAATVVAIFWEAAPFLLLGSLVGALIEEVVPMSVWERWIPQKTLPGVCFGLFAGLVLPTCECGVVPIVRKLMQKGVPPTVAITYLTAAPVINLVVLLSTYTAYSDNLMMVLGRMVVVGIVAIVLGVALSGIPNSVLLKQKSDHHSHHECCDHDHGVMRSRTLKVLAHTAKEFMDMGRYLLLGGVTVACFKMYVPYEPLEWLSGVPMLSIGMMMVLAILLSVCSEADAFVAKSFVGFPPSAQLAFITLGPMFDLKLLMMFMGVFHRRLVIVLAIVSFGLVYVLSYGWGVWVGW